MNANKNSMMIKLMALEFQVLDLALYLDTHTMDRDALVLHNKFSEELEVFKEAYRTEYGPITIEDTTCGKWAWADDPWPWDINSVGGVR